MRAEAIVRGRESRHRGQLVEPCSLQKREKSLHNYFNLDEMTSQERPSFVGFWCLLVEQQHRWKHSSCTVIIHPIGTARTVIYIHFSFSLSLQRVALNSSF